MKKRYRLLDANSARLATLGLTAAFALGAAPANAVTITNLTTNTVLFHDDFENGLSATSPSVGTWSIVGPAVTATNALIPGPAQGSFYTQHFRDSDINAQGNLRAQLSAAQTNIGDVIRLSLMLYLPSSTDASARAQLMLDNGDFNTARAWFIPDGAGHVMAVGAGFAQTNTGLLYMPDTWQEWDLQYAIGASTFDLSVNGVTASGFSSYTSGPVSFVDLFNGVKDPAGSIFLDAVPLVTNGVPEPSTWAMMLIGLAGVGFVGWKDKRRRAFVAAVS
jgi:hypothetical protein